MQNENQPSNPKYSQRFKSGLDRIFGHVLGEDPYQKALQQPAIDHNAELRAVVEQAQRRNDQITAGVRAAEAATAQPATETDPDLAMLTGDQVVTADDVLKAIDGA